MLHGTLEFHAIAARDLPDTDNFNFFNRGDKTDPYLAIDLCDTKLLKTKVIHDNLNPEWDEKFKVAVCHQTDTVRIKVDSVLN